MQPRALPGTTSSQPSGEAAPAGSSAAPAAWPAAGPRLRSCRTGYGGSTCTAAAPSLRAHVCRAPPQNILSKAPVKQFLRSSLPLRAGCNQTACARGQQAAERQSPALSSSSITMLLTTLYPGAGTLSLELCLSHYCASAHFALFTFLLFKEITLKCASASFTFCSYWSSP